MLFGHMIPMNDCSSSQAEEKQDSSKEATEVEVHALTASSSEVSEEEVDKVVLDVSKHRVEDDKKLLETDKEAAVDSKSELEKIEADGSTQDTVLKKPDKILPCPRCNSMDTKFCYFNNYNINQPRHFCKKCQRYWTAGGTMRNVPVGAGRRKSKDSAAQYRLIVVGSDGLQSAKPDAPDLIHQHTLPFRPSAPIRPINGNGNAPKLRPEGPLCESMDSTLNIREQHKHGDISSAANGESKEEPSCASSLTAPNCAENGHVEATNMEQIRMQGYMNGVTTVPHFQCYSGAPLVFPCGAGFLRPDGSNLNPVPWMPSPAFYPPAFPFPLMPSPFWGCFSGWPNGAWSVPLLGTNDPMSLSSTTSNSGSGNVSPTLGKHCRDSNLHGEEKVEKSLWIPKTLRIHDPEEAAKSSIWATLGIKRDERCIFKSFKSKVESNTQASDSAPLLHANPAALARSQSFQEGI